MHTFQRDEVVVVFNQTLSGKFIIEGKATIVRPIEDFDEQYIVKMPSSDGYYEHLQRFVDPAGQVDPEAHLDELNAPRA